MFKTQYRKPSGPLVRIPQGFFETGDSFSSGCPYHKNPVISAVSPYVGNVSA